MGDMEGKMTFWDAAHLCVNDSLNAEIWADSPNVQRSIQNPDDVRDIGRVGAQQAMLNDGRTVLPWVPDIVGKEWMRPDGLMVVGSAYAGFIKEFSGRGRALCLYRYTSAAQNRDAKLAVAEFQSHFLSNVVMGDHNYYDPIAELAAATVGSLTRLALFDLCRASFVQRGSRQSADRDKSGDSVVRSDTKLFECYVEHAKARDWTWHRLTTGEARCIIALGTIAEHGLLRLFAQRGCSIAASNGAGDVNASSISLESGGRWVERYADPGRNLCSWLNQGAWWTIQGTVGDASRTWRLLPVYHPSQHNRYDRGYRRTIELIGKMYNQQ